MTANNPLVRLMQRYGIPVTREAYLDLAFLGQAPQPLGSEQEADLPVELQRTAR